MALPKKSINDIGDDAVKDLGKIDGLKDRAWERYNKLKKSGKING